MSLSVDVLNVKGEKVETLELPEDVFGVRASSAVIHEVINAYLANARRGTHSTKTRAEVSGGGVKPWKQKHTGRARSGSTRSPLWRHGGVAFGPKPRSYFQAIPLSKRHLVMKAVLSDCLKAGRMKVVDQVAVSEPKTRKVAEIVKKLGMPAGTILLTDKKDDVLMRAARNIEGLGLMAPSRLNSYEVLRAKMLVFTKGAVDQVIKRLTDGAEKVSAA